jgi:hypothetical protein
MKMRSIFKSVENDRLDAIFSVKKAILSFAPTEMKRTHNISLTPTLLPVEEGLKSPPPKGEDGE